MKKNSARVMIFQDPLTCLKKEGMAQKVKFIKHEDFMLDGVLLATETWEVRFPGERSVYRRIIKV